MVQENSQDGGKGRDIIPGKRIKLGGWLYFFLVMILFEGIMNCVTALMEILSQGQLNFIFTLSILPSYSIVIGKLILIAYLIISFLKRRCNAVFIGKVYAIIMLIILLIRYLCNLPYVFPFDLLYRVCFYGSFILYLIYSKRIKALFPKELRKSLKRDYWIIAMCIFLPIILVTITSLVLLSLYQ